jgi:integrase
LRSRSSGGLTENEQRELWASLFLTLPEVAELLELVRANARHDWIYPMFCFAAHTGARRSEILRSRISDFDFQAKSVLIRERKRAKGRLTTRRVPLSGFLASVMRAWFDTHPGGIHSIGQPLRNRPGITSRFQVGLGMAL